ncbi:MAG: chorismate--pyruvate lyase family protein [Thiotrichales bacterium]
MTEHFFRSSGYLADGHIVASDGAVWDIAELPPFLRTLLVMDGTVTKSLEAYFWEPVEVLKSRQFEQASDAPPRPPVPLATTISTCLVREVALVGRRSRRRFACARSWLALDALPPPLAAGIREGRIGIGELLREQGVETYRQIVALDVFGARHDDPLLGDRDGVWVARAYRIRVSGTPAILVSEFFPLELYRDAASSPSGGVLTRQEL